MTQWRKGGGFRPLSVVAGGASAPLGTFSNATIAKPPVVRDATGDKTFHHARHTWLALVARDRKIPGAALSVAVLIWEHQNAKRQCAWPAFDYMAKKLGLNRSTVTRAVKLLERRQWITVRRNTGRYRSNEYRLAFGKMES